MMREADDVQRNREIERKFLVTDPSVVEDSEGNREGVSLVQGYLSSANGRSVRVRLVGAQEGQFTVTVKGPRRGPERSEVECYITSDVAEELLEACGSSIVEKVRYPVPGPEGNWVVDVFHDLNEGLVLAEVELSRADTPVVPPMWCGMEVTDDERYYNENLARRPYTTWTK